ncbi:hypothetical protein Fcan01_26658 [Folsomia candida]|uniref:Uncharacterized protein n=1 Tax=Folsomia candida TaxID=158441 RepID=A0A226D1X2_FOLCA|nr:hypothetical protein Fcan01_26658 [Folsomia candida]
MSSPFQACLLGRLFSGPNLDAGNTLQLKGVLLYSALALEIRNGECRQWCENRVRWAVPRLGEDRCKLCGKSEDGRAKGKMFCGECSVFVWVLSMGRDCGVWDFKGIGCAIPSWREAN